MGFFEIRGYEIHSPRMWQQAQIDMAHEFMAKNDLNALILHENALTDEVIFPDKYFSNEILWARWPVRRAGLLYRRDYMQKVMRDTVRRGFKLFFETKEIYFDMTLLEMHPEVRMENGSLCPSHPFWPEFLREKMEELLLRFPDIAGLIVSLGTQESLVSFAANRCNCDRCKAMGEQQWYISMLEALYAPLAARGKILMARDFASGAGRQNMLINACRAVSEDIVVSLKVQPHDYWPPFPTNPRIGACGGLREYVEFDVWGQFFGSGAFPTGQVEDIKRRMDILRQKKVWGVAFRTDWELMTDAHTHNSLSMLNLLAGSMLASDPDTPLDNIYRKWVDEELYDPLISGSYLQPPIHPKNPEAWKNLKAFMKEAWEIFEGAYYIGKHIFLEHDQPPCNLQMMFREIDRKFLDDWEPDASQKVLASRNNLPVIMHDKEQALGKALKLRDILDIPSLGLDKKTAEHYGIMLDAMVLYVKMCVYITRAGYLARIAQQEGLASDWEALRQAVLLLYAWSDEAEQFLKDTGYPYYIYARLPAEKMGIFARSLEALPGYGMEIK